MKNIVHTVNSEASLQDIQRYIEADYRQHKYLQVEVAIGKVRTLPQNSMIYALYARATHTPKGEGHTTLDIRCLCKLTLGIPILYTENKKFRESYQRDIKPYFDYEHKIRMMTFFPVSSLMSTEQESRYIDAILAEYGLDDTR